MDGRRGRVGEEKETRGVKREDKKKEKDDEVTLEVGTMYLAPERKKRSAHATGSHS